MADEKFEPLNISIGNIRMSQLKYKTPCWVTLVYTVETNFILGAKFIIFWFIYIIEIYKSHVMIYFLEYVVNLYAPETL